MAARTCVSGRERNPTRFSGQCPWRTDRDRLPRQRGQAQRHRWRRCRCVECRHRTGRRKPRRAGHRSARSGRAGVHRWIGHLRHGRSHPGSVPCVHHLDSPRVHRGPPNAGPGGGAHVRILPRGRPRNCGILRSPGGRHHREVRHARGPGRSPVGHRGGAASALGGLGTHGPDSSIPARRSEPSRRTSGVSSKPSSPKASSTMRSRARWT